MKKKYPRQKLRGVNEKIVQWSMSITIIFKKKTKLGWLLSSSKVDGRRNLVPNRCPSDWCSQKVLLLHQHERVQKSLFLPFFSCWLAGWIDNTVQIQPIIFNFQWSQNLNSNCIIPGFWINLGVFPILTYFSLIWQILGDSFSLRLFSILYPDVLWIKQKSLLQTQSEKGRKKGERNKEKRQSEKKNPSYSENRDGNN